MRPNKRCPMNKNNCFLKWWLLNCVILILGFISFKLNLFHEIYQKDSSYLCFIIMVLFFVVNFYNGFIAYNLDKNKTIESKTEIAWFISELCLSLGMIGTVIGFIQMLAGFSSLNIGNVSSMQSLVVNMGYGMATALYTTLAGLIFGNILKIEAFDIERSFKNMVEQNGNK